MHTTAVVEANRDLAADGDIDFGRRGGGRSRDVGGRRGGRGPAVARSVPAMLAAVPAAVPVALPIVPALPLLDDVDSLMVLQCATNRSICSASESSSGTSEARDLKRCASAVERSASKVRADGAEPNPSGPRDRVNVRPALAELSPGLAGNSVSREPIAVTPRMSSSTCRRRQSARHAGSASHRA